MTTKQAVISSLKEGGYIILDGTPAVIKSMQISKTGKHGHAKCRVEAVGMVDNRKIIKIMPGSDKVEVPIIEKKSAQVLSINNNSANLMDTETFETFDIEVPDDIKGSIMEGGQVMYWIILGKKVLKQVK